MPGVASMTGGMWFTADLHFGHRLVAGHRGFGEDTDAHDAAIVERWCARVKDQDTVWVLGDLSVSHFEHPLRILHGLPGKKRLVLGNHDAAHPMHRSAAKSMRHYLDVFEFVSPFARIKVEGREVLLSHFPYAAILSPLGEGPEWRETQHEGYFANKDGQVRGRSGRILQPWIAGAGYEYVGISTIGGKKDSTVHSMVCHAFHGPRPEDMDVAHNDGDPSNNRASNLRWVRRGQVAADRHAKDGQPESPIAGEANPAAKLTWDDVRFIRESSVSVRELAEQFGVGESAVRSVLNGDTWKDPRPDAPPGRDRGAVRYSQYRLRNEGRWLLHGHTHSERRVTSSREIHVGVDAWDLAPANLGEITTIMHRFRSEQERR